MGKVFIRGGTPTGSASLCHSCTSAHIMTGYRESEKVTMCNDVHPNIVVPFLIYNCSGYYDKNRPDWEQMEKLAITVAPAPLKPVGFKTGPGFATAALSRKSVDEDGDED